MKKRLLLGVGLPLALVPMALVACGSGSSVKDQVVEYLTRVRDENGTHKIYDFSQSVEGLYPSTETSRFYSSDLIFEAAEGDMSVNARGESLKKTKLYYKLGTAKAVYVTKKDGTVVVYDSDDHEKEGEVVLNNWQRMISDNEKSMNHPSFLKNLEDAKKLQFTLKDVNWVDVKGEKTDYKLKPEDYYSHFKHALQMNASYRHSTEKTGGGSEAADKLAAQKWTQMTEGSKRFAKEDGLTTNQYLFALFGADTSKLENKETYVQKAPETEEDAVTIEGLSDLSKVQMHQLFTKVLLNSTYFWARPSDYTKANKEKNVKDVSNEVADYGYYWYGGNWREMLFVSPYIPSELTELKESRVLNKNYYDQEWVKDSKTVGRFVVERKRTDLATFQTNEWEAYKAGEIPRVRFSQLGAAEQEEVQKNPLKYHLKYQNILSLNTTPSGTMLWNSIPARKNPRKPDAKDSKKFDTREYNDAYSLMMWGKTIAETEAENAPMVSKHYYLGDGLRFRSLISNAYNIWARTVNANDQERPWIVPISEGNNIGGSDHATGQKEKLIDHYDLLNTTFAFNEKGEKIATKNWTNDKSHYEKPEVQGNKDLAVRSSTYDTIKAEMKKLLDSFFAKHTTLKDKKIEFTSPLRSGTLGSKELATFSGIAKMLNSLDSRINVKYSDTYDLDALIRLWDERGTARPWGWNFDYNGVGTWLDGVFHFGDGSPSEIGLLYQLAAEPAESQFAKSLPELYKLANALKGYSAFFPDGSPTFEQRKNATTEQLLVNGGKFHKGTAKDFNYTVVLSEFFFEYQNKTKNADLLKLVQEVQAVIGVHPMTLSGSIINPQRALPFLKSNKFETPYSPSAEVSYRFMSYTGQK